MAQKTMYNGYVNSIPTTTTNAISSTDTVIYVLDNTRIPESPNLLVLGTDTSAETVRLVAKDGDMLTVERGFQGTAKAWVSGTLIARNFTEYDHRAFKENIEDLKLETNNLQTKADEFDLHKTEKAHYPVSKPQSFQGIGGDSVVDLSWSNPNDLIVKDISNNNVILAEFEEVELKRGGVVIYTGTATSCRDEGLVNGQTYNYEIVSISTAGIRSEKVEISVVPAPFTMDWAHGVSDLVAKGEDTQVTLTWTNPTVLGFEGVIIRGSDIEYPANLSDGVLVYDGAGTTVAETGLANDVPRYYTVWAYNDANQYSDNANKKQATATPVPFTMDLGYNVTNFNLQIGDGRITGTWDNPTQPDFEGVMVRGGATAPATILDGTLVYQGNLETFLETGLPNGTEKFYTIWCYNDSNQYSATAISKSAIPAPFTMDWAYGVTNLSSQSGDTQITLTWTNPVQPDFEGVMVRASNTAYPTAITEGVLVYDGAGTTVTETGLANDAPRYYTVWAYNNTNQYSDNANKKQITVSASALKIYGVKIDINNSNPETAVTYTDDAVGLTPMKSTNGVFNIGSWADKFPFNAIKPCLVKNGIVNYYLNPNDYTKKADGTPADITTGTDGDVMVEFPKIYWKFSEDSTHRYIQYSDKPFTGAKCLAHMRGVAEKDKCYISAYLGFETGGKLRSLSGKTPAVNKTIGAFRTIAQANGVGYDQMAYYQLLMLQVLYIVAFKNLDSQTALGRGYVDNNSTSIATGGTNTKGMFYGETTGKQQMKFCGIEDFYGNCFYWIDGFFCDASRNILIANQNFNNTGSGYANYGQGATANLSGYISDIQGGTETGFVIKGTTGSATTYYSDYGSLNAGYLPIFGGSWGDASSAGAFCFYCIRATSSSYANYSARLLACV